MKKTIIVSAFPACGKSYIFENQTKFGEDFSCLDSDSSEFSWVKDSEGKNTSERNPDFPNNYIQHIKDNVGKVDIVFVSSHAAVVNVLEENNLAWVKVVPEESCKAEWIGRFWLRGNDDKFICFIRDNWETFTDTRMDYAYTHCVGTVVVQPTKYIEDSLDFIMSCSGNY